MESNSKSQESTHWCDQCKRQFANKSSLNRHKNIHLNKRDFECHLCGFTCNTKVTLNNHMTSHTNERAYKCQHPNCSSTYKTAAALATHRRQIHVNKREFKCPLCDFAANLRPLLIRHIQRHTGEKPHKCPESNCNSAFAYIQGLNSHGLVHRKHDESLKKFKCSQCPFKTTNKSNLRQHLNLHLDDKPYACDLCPFQSKHKSNVTKHRKTVHSTQKPFKCPRPGCHASFKYKSSIKSHLSMHKKDRLFVCSVPECTFKSNWEKSLRAHQLIHQGIKRFRCPHCPFANNNKGYLAVHIRRHTGETPYHCPNCSHRVKSSALLAIHLKNCKPGAKELQESRTRQIFATNIAVGCKIETCGFSAKDQSTIAVHYNMVHKLPKVNLSKEQTIISLHHNIMYNWPRVDLTKMNSLLGKKVLI